MRRGYNPPGQRTSRLENFSTEFWLVLAQGAGMGVLGDAAIGILHGWAVSLQARAVPILAAIIVIPMFLLTIQAHRRRTEKNAILLWVQSISLAGFQLAMYLDREVVRDWAAANARYVWILYTLPWLYAIYFVCWRFSTEIADPLGPRPPMAVSTRTKPSMPWDDGEG